MIWKYALPVIMLAGANVLVNIAWFGHLKAPDRALWLAIVSSWGIAFFEYCMVVPAMRLGSTVYSLPELKTLQVTFSILMFIAVAWWLFGEKPGPSTIAGFTLVATGAFFVFKAPLG